MLCAFQFLLLELAVKQHMQAGEGEIKHCEPLVPYLCQPLMRKLSLHPLLVLLPWFLAAAFPSSTYLI